MTEDLYDTSQKIKEYFVPVSYDDPEFVRCIFLFKGNRDNFDGSKSKEYIRVIPGSLKDKIGGSGTAIIEDDVFAMIQKYTALMKSTKNENEVGVRMTTIDDGIEVPCNIYFVNTSEEVNNRLSTYDSFGIKPLFSEKEQEAKVVFSDACRGKLSFMPYLMVPEMREKPSGLLAALQEGRKGILSNIDKVRDPNQYF